MAGKCEKMAGTKLTLAAIPLVICNSEKSEHEALEHSGVIHIHPTSLQKPHVFQYALYHWCGEEGGALLLVFHCIRERLYDLGSACECTVCLALIDLFLVYLPEFHTH